MTLDTIWVYTEATDDEVSSTTLELLTKARELADDVACVFAGDGDDVAEKLGEFGGNRLDLAFNHRAIRIDEECLNGIQMAHAEGGHDLGMGSRAPHRTVERGGEGVRHPTERGHDDGGRPAFGFGHGQPDCIGDPLRCLKRRSAEFLDQFHVHTQGEAG